MSTENGNGFNKDSVLKRIRKMLALANDAAASEGERDNALRMIHATLAKYNLSMAEAEAAGQTAEEKRVNNKADDILPHAWARIVAQAIAHLYFCEYYYSKWRGGSNKVSHYFIGRESNTITAQEMTAYVVRSIQKEANKRKRELGVNGPWERSFCNGAAYHIHERCAKLRKEAEEQPVVPTTGTSIVLASFYATEALANKALLPSKLKTSRGAEITNAAAAHAGRQFGATVNLNRQVGDSRIKGALT